MASIEENINQAISDFDKIKESIVESGVDVPYGTDTNKYGELISQVKDKAFEAGINSVDLSDYVKFTDYPKVNGSAGVLKVVSSEHGINIGSNGNLYVQQAYNSDVAKKESNYRPVVPSVIDTAVYASTHQEMSDEYAVSSFTTGATFSYDKSTLPASYAAVKGYVDGLVGEISTALDEILALQESYIEGETI